MVMHLACVIFHMSMQEALNAATINAAHALGVSDKHGSIEIGKYGNLVILNAERLTFHNLQTFNSEFDTCM